MFWIGLLAAFILGAWFGIGVMAALNMSRDYHKCKSCITKGGKVSDW